MADETDAEALTRLRRYRGWSTELDALGVRAAMAGRLQEACARALGETSCDSESSSLLSRTISFARVPPHFNEFSNYAATFYSRLRKELLTVVGTARHV